MRVAVTGATGFVGSAVARALEARGHRVTGFGRRPAGPVDDHRVWVLPGPPPALAPGEAFDALVHCAALADDWAPRAEAFRVNRDGTAAVAAAFPGARIVHLSTSSVYDAFRPTVEAREGTRAPRRFLSVYSESKLAAEHALVGCNAVILRPHAVYGPGDTTLLPRIEEAARHGRLALPGGGRVRHSLTHIDNLVDAVELALTGPAGTYNIADGAPVELRAALEEFLARRGVGTAISSVPYAAAFALASVAELAARVVGVRPRLTRYAVSQVGLERTLDISAARTRLGFAPHTTDLDGAAAWCPHPRGSPE